MGVFDLLINQFDCRLPSTFRALPTSGATNKSTWCFSFSCVAIVVNSLPRSQFHEVVCYSSADANYERLTANGEPRMKTHSTGRIKYYFPWCVVFAAKIGSTVCVTGVFPACFLRRLGRRGRHDVNQSPPDRQQQRNGPIRKIMSTKLEKIVAPYWSVIEWYVDSNATVWFS